MNKQATPDWVLERLKEEEFLRNQLTVTEADYTEAVQFLVSHAKRDTSGSRAAAQLLLSLYNGSNWHMDLSDFCVMDYDMMLKALIAIRGRVLLSKEPHNAIENGSKIFAKLEKDWQHFHVKNRYSSNQMD